MVAPSRPGRGVGKRLLVMLLATAVLLVASETGFRLLATRLGVDRDHLERVRRFVREGPRHYEARPYTSFGLRRGDDAAAVHHRVNSLGFLGGEWRRERTPGVPRIVCLGASTTQGGNASGLTGAYPWLLERELEQRTGRDFEVLNGGVSGWTTAETLVSWILTVRDFEPDLVIVHHAVNDVGPRSVPGFRADYLHWRTEWDPPRYSPAHVALTRCSELYSWLTMRDLEVDVTRITTTLGRGVRGTLELPPETRRPFRRNVASLGEDAERVGADVMLMTMPFYVPKGNAVYARGVGEHNEVLRELCRERGWMLADPAVLIDERRTALRDAVFLDGVHVRPQGNLTKARTAADVLLEAWVPSLAPGGPPAPASER